MPEILEIERKYLLENHQVLAARHPNQFLVIQGEQVFGAYDDYDQAVDSGIERLEGDFLVRHVNDPEDPVVFIPTVLELPLDVRAAGSTIDSPS